jgi:hypothetical protein
MKYDIKELLNRLEGLGLTLAEDAAVIVIDEVFEWAAAEAIKSENKIDDIIAGLLPMIKPVIITDLLDQIDGEDNR